jgi:hypothetical protein
MLDSSRFKKVRFFSHITEYKNSVIDIYPEFFIKLLDFIRWCKMNVKQNESFLIFQDWCDNMKQCSRNAEFLNFNILYIIFVNLSIY